MLTSECGDLIEAISKNLLPKCFIDKISEIYLGIGFSICRKNN